MTALEPMRALTLKPWWAHAVAFLDKDIENRAKPPPEALIGKRIAIHAGAPTWASTAWLDEIDRAMGRERRRMWVRRHRDRHGHLTDPGGTIVPLMEPTLYARPGLAQVRAIVATADLAGILHDHNPRPRWGIEGMVWWMLRDVRPLYQPVHVERGQLGLWRLPPEVDAVVRRRECLPWGVRDPLEVSRG